MTDSVCCVCGTDDWVRAKPGDTADGTEAQRWCTPCDPTVSEFVTTRAEALERGLMFYRTGKPCGNGHIAPRYARNRTGCKACADARILRQRKSGRRSEIDNAYYHRKAIRNQTSRDWSAAKRVAI